MMDENQHIARAAAALDDPDVRREATAPRAVDPLREALEHIRKPKYGLQGIMEDYSDANAFNYHAMKYWRDLAQQYQAAARAALAAAPQPAPVDRGMLVGVITEALYRHGDKGWTPSGSVNDIADALIAAGLRLPGAVQPTMRDETGMEHIARDIREGRFPKRSPRQQVPDTTVQPDETPAWAVVGKDGEISLVYLGADRREIAELIAEVEGKVAVRVAIRRVEDAA